MAIQVTAQDQVPKDQAVALIHGVKVGREQVSQVFGAEEILAPENRVILALITKDQALILTTMDLETLHQLILVKPLLKFLQEAQEQFKPHVEQSMRTGLLCPNLTGLGDLLSTAEKKMRNSKDFSLTNITFTELVMDLHLLHMTLNLPGWLRPTLKKWM